MKRRLFFWLAITLVLVWLPGCNLPFERVPRTPSAAPMPFKVLPSFTPQPKFTLTPTLKKTGSPQAVTGTAAPSAGATTAVAPKSLPTQTVAQASATPKGTLPGPVKITLAAQTPNQPNSKIELNVNAGNYTLKNGFVAPAGTVMYVQESELALTPGLIIEIARGGVTLAGFFYPAGTRLTVTESGRLVESK